MGNTCQATHMLGLDLVHQLCHAGRRAGTLEAQTQTIDIERLHGNAARVIATVLQSLQTLDQNRNDIAIRDRSNNATHRCTPQVEFPGILLAEILNISSNNIIY